MLLRDKREDCKLSQVEFARKALWPQTTVSRVEQGRRSVSLPELFDVAQVLGCSVADLLEELHTEKDAVVQVPPQQPYFTPGFSVAFGSEEATLAQLARYGVRFLGGKERPDLMTLPAEEVVLAALRFATEPRVFEALPVLLLKHSFELDWSKLVSGAYALRLQNRLGMALAAGLQLKDAAKGVDQKTWSTLQAAHDSLVEGKLDREEVLGPRPKTEAALALLRSRTPEWLRFWNAVGSADLESYRRYLSR